MVENIFLFMLLMVVPCAVSRRLTRAPGTLRGLAVVKLWFLLLTLEEEDVC